MNWVLRAAAKNKKCPRHHEAGSIQMEKYGLFDDITTEKDTWDAAALRHNLNQAPLARMPVFHEHLRGNVQSTPTTPPLEASLALGGSTNTELRGSPAREESVEEQMLRRRRREAMVLEDEGMPLSSANIIERVSPEWETVFETDVDAPISPT